MKTDRASPKSENGTAVRCAGEKNWRWYIHTTTQESTVMTMILLRMRGMMEPRSTKNRASAEGRGRTIMMNIKQGTSRRSLYACDRAKTPPI
ncbi:MAG: hypothetical protein K0S02_5001 [Achromobacter mucicolens]|jgi:hypothetical protein|nr:hypothetical protein [Achromobacter mucicolens]